MSELKQNQLEYSDMVKQIKTQVDKLIKNKIPFMLTPDDVANGKSGSCSLCPMALAILASLPKVDTVIDTSYGLFTIEAPTVTVGCNIVNIFSRILHKGSCVFVIQKSYFSSKRIQSFIDKFDTRTLFPSPPKDMYSKKYVIFSSQGTIINKVT